jgi:hypothetical protein
MRLASKGLGKVTLPFRFAGARITEAPDCLVLEGIIKEKKVNWPYRAEIEDSDIINFLILARSPAVASYLAGRVGLGIFTRLLWAAFQLILYPFRQRATVEAGKPVSRSDDSADEASESVGGELL